MKRNIYGLIISAFYVLNVIIMLNFYFTNDLGPRAKNYIIGGTIFSILLLILIHKKYIIGYIGTILFFGFQVIGSNLILNNFKYGLVYNLELTFSQFTWDFNLIAIVIVILGILGLINNENNKTKANTV